MNSSKFSRRTALKSIAGGTAAVGAVLTTPSLGRAAEGKVKGNIRHSVCKWCYGSTGLEKLAAKAASLGMESVELLNPPEFATIQKHDLICAMVSFPVGTLKDGKTRVGGIGRAFNRLEHHDTLVEIYEQRIKETAKAGFKKLICFSGNRAGMDDETGLKNCAIGLKRILPIAERHNVTIAMELLNSRVNHKDYMCDRTAWGVELCKAIDSERFGLLYDIYHMQIMEGNVIQTIRNNHQYIAHYHTAGVPGRHELDRNQELNWRTVAQAIADTGFTGYLAHEFIPTRDPRTSLQEAVTLCNV